MCALITEGGCFQGNGSGTNFLWVFTIHLLLWNEIHRYYSHVEAITKKHPIPCLCYNYKIKVI